MGKKVVHENSQRTSEMTWRLSAQHLLLELMSGGRGGPPLRDGQA